jgi:hypothetical protein
MLGNSLFENDFFPGKLKKKTKNFWKLEQNKILETRTKKFKFSQAMQKNIGFGASVANFKATGRKC